MTTNVAINGFGRIGLLALRGMLERHKQELSVVAVNDMADLHTNTHLFRYDSTYGAFPGKVGVGEGRLRIDDWDIVVLSEKDPSRLPWQKLGVDIVIESTVSVVDLVLDLKKSASVEAINDSLKTAAEGDLDTILEYCDEPLVFSDFRGNPASSIVDGLSTVVLDGKMTKVLAWYDNEWGYSCRVGDLATLMAEREL